MEILHLFPRPKNDTGIGAHASAGGQQKYAGTEWDNWAYDRLQPYYRGLRERYGICWWKMLGDGSPGSVMNAKAATDAGMEVIVRRYTEKPHWAYVLPTETVRAYVTAGVHYFEYGNEPNLGLEVQGMIEGQPVIGHQHVVSMCNQFIANCNSIVAGGGIVLIPAMAPGNMLDDTSTVVCPQSFIKWFQTAKMEDGSSAWEWFVDQCEAGHVAIAGHFRGGNHAVVYEDGRTIIDYPDDPVNQLGEPMSVEDAAFHGIDEAERQRMNVERMEKKNPGATLWQDSTSYLAGDLVAELFNQALGFKIPIIETEAGPEPFEQWEGRYPRTTLEAHSRIAMEIVRRMNPDHPKATRRQIFTRCFWIWDNEDHGPFRQAAWVNNKQLGIDLPAAAALEALMRDEPFVRDTEEAPPMPEPTPPEEEPMTDKLTIILHDMWARQGVNVSLEDGFFKAAVQQARLNGVYVIPQPSKDGDFTTDVDGYRIAYTFPPMYAAIGDWGNVKTGLPF